MTDILKAESVKYIPASSLQSTSWKNGGGSTVQIYVAPESADINNFDWRLSLATVSVDGSFSIFEGIDRTITIVSGNGITLDVEGLSRPVTLEIDSAPFSFAADVPTKGRLINNHITDLNIMTARNRFTHEVERRNIAKNTTINIDSHINIIFAVTNFTVRLADKDHHLQQHDTLIVSGPKSSLEIMTQHSPTFLSISVNKVE